MQGKRILFVAFLEQDNLGVGYIASIVLQNYLDVKIIDFREGNKSILELIRSYNPSIVGFSIIFQYHIDDFRRLITYLRRHKINSHFTAGGHYPSLRYAELLQTIPELNSVVLFEGEHTFLTLSRAVCSQKEWRHIDGIAYRENSRIVANPLRSLEKDLDRFPPPVRQPPKQFALGRKYATLLAGRGCYRDCAFCSIRQFYSKPSGLLKRMRRPEMVVREMELLHRELDCSIFIFQDDDFPVAGREGRRWATRFCELLTQKGLHRRFMWKINCRPDEIQPTLFQTMKEAGLFLVYMGIEDGTDVGLRLMNKHITPQTNIKAVDALKKLGISYDFGFMLFNPETTFDSVIQNIDFLERICADGSAPITFCKMLPYAETRIESILQKQGRLKGKAGFKDYDFRDPYLDCLHSFMVDCFYKWIARRDGLLNLAKWSRYYLSVYHKYYGKTPISTDLDQAMTECVSQSNNFFIETTRKIINLFNSHPKRHPHKALETIRDVTVENHRRYKRRLQSILDGVEQLAR